MTSLMGSDDKIIVERDPDSVVGVYYTSGSTGQPKGVAYAHRSMLHFIRTFTNKYCMNPDDKQPLPFSCSYAWSISPMFGTLLCGGTLFLIDLRTMGLQKLSAFVEEKEITILQLSTGMFRTFMAGLDKTKRHFPHLKVMVTGGEPMQAQDVRLWQELFSKQTVLGCTFAASEAWLLTFNPIYHDSEIPDGIVSPGYPTPEKEILIVDEERRPLPAGEAGEIAIRSEYLAHGYWNKPELTDAVFLKDPEDPSKRIYYSNDRGRILPNGMLEHLGRKDSFAKVRGYSVDLLEVEQAIYDLHDIKYVVVVPIPARHDPDQKQLAAYLKADPSVPRDIPALRKSLLRKLPSYMIPNHFVFLDEMPLNLNGKVDKKALPPVEYKRKTSETDHPTDETERRLVEIWQDVLKLKEISVHDNFFDLGGDSLLAMTLLLEIEKSFATHLPLAVISQASNIKGQAEMLRDPTVMDFSSILIPIRTIGNKKPLFCISGRGGDPIKFHHLLRHLPEDQPVYFFRSRGFQPGERLLMTVEEIASDYLREIKRIQPEGPYCFIGESGGGMVAYEMAQQLLAQGDETRMVGMLDTYFEEIRENKILEVDRNPLILLQKHFQTLTHGSLREYINYYKNLLIFRAQERENEKKRRQVQQLSGNAELYKRVDEANMNAGRNYDPKPYAGRVVLFRAGRQLKFDGGIPDHGWGRVAVNNLVIRELDCYHGNILFEPFVQEVAKEINIYL